MGAPTARRVLGRYELLELLGRGAATESFRAKSFGVEGFEKTIVLKRMLPEFVRQEAFVAAFLLHVQRAMRLSHANLAQVFDLGKSEEEDLPSYFLATEFVSGVDVGSLLERSAVAGEPMPIELGLYLGLEVAKALDHAHRRRDEELRPLAVAHGAVAPHAVLVSFDGDVKLTDFGTTRALLTLPRTRESLRRTVAALSPEQAVGAEPSVLSDVFSLGTFLYAALTGTAPFAATTIEETVRSVVRASPAPIDSLRSDVPAEVAALVHRALSPDPEERFPSVLSLHEELLACTYACGLRAGASDVAGFVERYREPPSTIPSESIDALLSRPLTVPPPAAAPESARDPAPATLTSVPPLTTFGELRHVSVLCLDLGKAAPSPNEDPRVRAIVERYGGVLSPPSGHGATALFGLDRSDGRDTELAVRCGLVLVRTFDGGLVRAAVGIDAGRIRLASDGKPLLGERTDRLVRAARALSEDARGRVLVSSRAASSLHGRFPLEGAGGGPAFRVKEFAQDRFVDSFVGRKAELRIVGEALVRAARGELGIVQIVGDPGVGKTRLAIEVQRRLSRGSVELVAHFATCPPRGREIPDSGLVAMLRRVCGVHDGDPPELVLALEPRLRALGMSADETRTVLAEIGRVPPEGHAPAPTALRSAFLKLMHSLSEDRFTVFVWDDAHELDAASCDTLEKARDRLASSRLAIVLCGRRDAGAPYGALPGTELGLGELDAADVERLAAERAGLTEGVPPVLLEFLNNRAGGQPMFVEELVKQLLEEKKLVVENGRATRVEVDDGVALPRSLRALTAERLRRLTDDERHLFVAAAVLEPPANIEVLARMVSLSVSKVDEIAAGLLGRGLLGKDGQRDVTFPSPLAREVVRAELDAVELSALHRRAAEALAAFFDERLDEEADQVGYHLAAAGDTDAAAEQYARSGFHCLSLRQLDRAAQGLAYALGLANLETRNADQIGSWLRALATAVRYVRGGPGLDPLMARLSARVEADPLPRSRLRIDLAYIHGALGRELTGEALLDGSAAEARGQNEVATALLTAYAHLASGRGDFRAARRALDPLGRLQLEDRDERHRVTLAAARTYAAGGQDDAARAALEDAAAAASTDDPLLTLDRAIVHTAIHMAAARFREAAEAAAVAASLAEELGLVYEVASSLSEQAVAWARHGDAARAQAVLVPALAAAAEVDAERVVLRSHVLLAFLEGGQAAPYEGMRSRIAQLESHGWIGDALLARYLLGALAARQGDVELAHTELELAARIATRNGNKSMAAQCHAEAEKLAR